MLNPFQTDFLSCSVKQHELPFSDTIGFTSVLTSYSTISVGSILLFNEVLLNEGDE